MAFFGFRKDKKAAQEKIASDAKLKRTERRNNAVMTRAADEHTETEKSTDKASTKKKSATSSARGTDFSVLIRPRITEKATDLSGMSAYTFDVRIDASKKDIIQAVKDVYHVTPRFVRTVPVRAKYVSSRRARNVYGRTARGKKAYVFLKKGDTIDFV